MATRTDTERTRKLQHQQYLEEFKRSAYSKQSHYTIEWKVREGGSTRRTFVLERRSCATFVRAATSLWPSVHPNDFHNTKTSYPTLERLFSHITLCNFTADTYNLTLLPIVSLHRSNHSSSRHKPSLPCPQRITLHPEDRTHRRHISHHEPQAQRTLFSQERCTERPCVLSSRGQITAPPRYLSLLCTNHVPDHTGSYRRWYSCACSSWSCHTLQLPILCIHGLNNTL